MEQILVRPEQAAELLALARSSIYELVKSGELPSVRYGKALRLPVEGLRAWAEARTEQASAAVEAK